MTALRNPELVFALRPEVRLKPESPPLQPLLQPAIQLLATQEALRSAFDSTLRRMSRIRGRLHKEPPREVVIYQAPLRPAKPMRPEELLPSSRRLLERMQNVPLLPAPPAFEEVFAPYEAIFHTVFYRRYPYARLDDAKQDGLLHLWKRWKKDMTVMEQSAAYIVQLAVWGASPHRKIEKDRRIAERELPMPRYERYIDVRVADQSREPVWVRNVDLSTDLKLAVDQVSEVLLSMPDAEARLRVLEDVIRGRTIWEGIASSRLSTRRYKAARKDILARLRTLLADYATV
ncbi:MAG: hypothetical protein L6Q98_24195 [Anaerolineae bacterium]|nr:hypothetical protein [Anaerolineae bacterium]NUQ06689.1 hypothetical protein [Anaerolineae bacterium]